MRSIYLSMILKRHSRRQKSFMEVCPGCSWISHEKGDNSFAFVATKTTYLMGHPIPRQFRSQHPKRYGERRAARPNDYSPVTPQCLCIFPTPGKSAPRIWNLSANPSKSGRTLHTDVRLAIPMALSTGSTEAPFATFP